jgi:hypothetical protein
VAQDTGRITRIVRYKIIASLAKRLWLFDNAVFVGADRCCGQADIGRHGLVVPG